MDKRGFTLIEIMIVLAIMAAVIGIGAPRLFKTQDNVKSVVRKFMVLGKEIRDKARINNATYRLAIHMEPKNYTYWVEKANGSQLIDPAAMTPEGRAKIEEAKKEKKDDAPPPLFQLDKSILKKEKSLPGQMRFVSLETINMKEPVVEGDAYIYFFPQGMVEASALQIATGSAGSNTWTLIFDPLTGQVDVIEKAQSLKDLQR